MAVRRKTALIVVGIAAILLVSLIFVVPALINMGRYRAEMISLLQEQSGKQVEIGRLRLTFFPVAIHIDNLGVKNRPPFPPGYILKVARIDAELNVGALLHRQVAFKSLVLRDPVINLTSDPDGLWNFENPQAKVSETASALGLISKVQIKRGQVIGSDLLPSNAAGPIFFEAREISCELEQVNLAAIISPTSSSMDGRGSLKASLLRFGAVEARNMDSKLLFQARHIYFTNVKATVYGGTAAGDLSFGLLGKNANFQTNARFSGIDVAQLLAAFPNGAGKMTGKMEGEVKLGGEIEHSLRPLAGVRGTGHVIVREGLLPTLQLNANVMKLAHFNDLGPAKENPSSFSSISSDLELANLRISSSLIDVDGYGVDVDGSGSVSVSGSDDLNYQGVAKIIAKQGFFTNTYARMHGATLKDGQLLFPFRVGGTIDNPVFSQGNIK